MTPHERATIYAMMIAEIDMPLIEWSTYSGYCNMTKYLFDNYSLLRDNLPELLNQKPPSANLFWFPIGQWTKRRQCLVNALLMIDKK